MHIRYYSQQIFSILDRTGATVPWVCAVHCLLMPIAASFLPIFGISFFADEGFEVVFIGMSLLIAAISLLPGYVRHHRKLQVLILFTVGIILVILADILLGSNLFGKSVLILVGAMMITRSHTLNRRFCRACYLCEKP